MSYDNIFYDDSRIHSYDTNKVHISHNYKHYLYSKVRENVAQNEMHLQKWHLSYIKGMHESSHWIQKFKF